MMTNIKTTPKRFAPALRAFTLIEILIVIALTTLLFALLLVPLVSAIKYTRQVQSLTAAQDAVRITRERLTRELSSAVFVFDGTGHRFQVPATATVVAGDDLFTNFSNLDIPTSTSGATTVAHAYAAKLDFALPRVNDTKVTDPTTGEAIAYGPSTSGSAVIVSPAQVFPSAAGASMVRYWVGLKDPTLPYNNNREASAARGANDNTYILYRAQFQPYVKSAPAGGAVSYPADTRLFALAVDGKTAEIDDPDFFRYVKDTDINWLDAGHLTYGATGGSAAHNTRVDNWRKLAKTVIPGPNVDLIQLPRNADNTLAYDTAAPFAGVAHSGASRDPISGKAYPIVNTTVTFRPGTVSGDATPASTTAYNSAGVPLVDQDGVLFIPSVYTAAAQSWSLPYKVTLTPPTAVSPQVSGGDTYTTASDPATGDTLEYNSADVAVFDLTTLSPIATDGKYIPLSVNADSGTITFDTPSFPNPANHLVREWDYTPVAVGTYFAVDLKTPAASPLGTIVDKTAVDKSGVPVRTARIVPGSVRVYGPDETAGPGQYQAGVSASSNQPLVLYTEATQPGTGDGPQFPNQYRIDYAKSIITLLGNAFQFGATANPAPVRVVYNYQANMAPVGTGPVTAMPDYVQNPMNVSVDYKTRDLLDISLGVRIYDVSTGRAQVLPSELKVKIGNSNR